MSDPCEIRDCPRCGQHRMTRHPALSRVDNKTEICSECGTAEAMCVYLGKPLASIRDWSINTRQTKPTSTVVLSDDGHAMRLLRAIFEEDK